MQGTLKQKNLVLFGAPGVGKGTYGKLIHKEFGFPTFSMGDYFRKVISEGAPDNATEEQRAFVNNLKDTLAKGHFVSDEMAIEVIKNARSTTYADTEVLIFDGMPRTIAQAEMLKKHEIGVDLIFNFTNRDDILLEKLMGRRVCPCCNRNYNIAAIDRDGYFMKALLPDGDPTKCGDCEDSTLVIRDDDKEHIIKERMEIYRTMTEPILDFYKDSDKTQLINFEAKKGVDDFPQMKKLLEDALAKI